MKSKPISTSSRLTRRSAVQTAGVGLAAMACLSGPAAASEWTATERANIQTVNDFCAAWAGHDIDKIMSFFAENCAYRMTETQDAIKGQQAVLERIKSFVNAVQGFDVIETFAKGPMVVNERYDHFKGGPLKKWHGVGVFYLKDGKIAEWSDYTISMDRA
jgi:limonene-1,2-epoxide hydrolase